MKWKPDLTSGLILPEQEKKRRGVPDNPSDPAEWDKMADDSGPIYKVLCSVVSCKGPSGRAPAANDIPRYGWMMHAKDFGPGAEIQRLIDLRMIREASPQEVKMATVEKVDTVLDSDGDRPLKAREKAPPHKVVNAPGAMARA
jgi:hypothetical protein